MSGAAETRIAVVGAGLMGHGIAQAFMVAGFPVSIWGSGRGRAGVGPQRIAAHLALLGMERPVTVRVCDTLASCVAGSQLVIEAVPEKLELKRELLAVLDELNPDAIVATNTSVLRITEIAADSARPERVVGTHWWNPPYLIPVVEVVRGERTGEDVARRVSAWLAQAGKTPVDVYRDVPGFVGNRMQFALLREAAWLVEEGRLFRRDGGPGGQDDLRPSLGLRGPVAQRGLHRPGPDLRHPGLPLRPACPIASRRRGCCATRWPSGNWGAKSGQGVFEWEEGERDETEAQLLRHLIAAAGKPGRPARCLSPHGERAAAAKDAGVELQ